MRSNTHHHDKSQGSVHCFSWISASDGMTTFHELTMNRSFHGSRVACRMSRLDGLEHMLYRLSLSKQRDQFLLTQKRPVSINAIRVYPSSCSTFHFDA